MKFCAPVKRGKKKIFSNPILDKSRTNTHTGGTNEQ